MLNTGKALKPGAASQTPTAPPPQPKSRKIPQSLKNAATWVSSDTSNLGDPDGSPANLFHGD